MNYAVIKDGIVENIVISCESLAANNGWIKATEDVFIGCRYENGEFLVEATKLNQLKEDMVKKLKSKKTDMIREGCSTEYGIVQTDVDSMSVINSFTNQALENIISKKDFSILFTMKDNQSVLLNSQDIINLSATVSVWLNNIHSNVRRLRKEIDLADSESMIFDIDINTGWPEKTQ